VRYTRRNFIGTAAAVGAALGAAGGRAARATLAPPASEGDDRRVFHNGKLGLGLVTYNVGKDMDLETLITTCEAAQLDAVELRTTHAHGVEPSLTPEQRAAVRERFAASSVALAGLGSTCEYHSPDPDTVRAQIERTFEFVELAEDIGAIGVKVRPNGLPEGVDPEKTLEQIGRALEECAGKARECGVEIFVEVHGGGTSDPRNMRRIMDVCTDPVVGVTWNCNQSDLAAGSIKETFPLLRDRVKMIHTHDWYEDYPYKQELIPFLLEMGFTGYCLAEMPETADPVRVLRYYRKLFDEWVKGLS